MSALNRIVLVDETGRVYDRTGITVELSSQDDGLTLKVFVTPLPTSESARANQRHLTRLSESLNLYDGDVIPCGTPHSTEGAAHE